LGGKALLFVVLGFSLIFLIMEKNMTSTSTRTVDNMSSYYTNVNAHNIALAGANVGANKIFLDPTWTDGFDDVSFADGEYDVDVDIINNFQNIRRITSVGTFSGVSDTVQITLQPSKFSKFAYYSANEGSNIWWTTGDTVWGPMHTQSLLKIDGSPVFNGKVTSKLGMESSGHWEGWGWNQHWVSDATPEFNGGYQDGVDLPLPDNSITDLKTAAEDGGFLFEGQDTVYMTFAGDSLKYRFSYKDAPTTVLSSAFAPNGVIFANGATVRLQGEVAGRFTIGAASATKTIVVDNGKKKKKKKKKNKQKTVTVTVGGDIYLDNDVVYKSNPNDNPNSTDMLGIVSENNVYITDNKANKNDINIDAAIFAQKGGFGAENYANRPPSGIINLNGGITQNTRLPVGTFTFGGNISSGFSKSYHYDNRFLISSPPSFPNTGSFEIVSWYE